LRLGAECQHLACELVCLAPPTFRARRHSLRKAEIDQVGFWNVRSRQKRNPH
jgi:hypothetical protein